MGTWGTGNLDGDGPCDLLDSVIDNLEQEIEECFGSDGITLQGGEDVLMPALHIWSALCETCDGHAPQVEQLKRWKEAYLPVFEREMPELADAEFMAQRRKAIEATFVKLERQATEYWSKAGGNGSCGN